MSKKTSKKNTNQVEAINQETVVILKSGRGRPKGATSTVQISLKDLIEFVGNNMNATIHIGRTWMKNYSELNNVTPAETFEIEKNSPKSDVDSSEESDKIEFSVT